MKYYNFKKGFTLAEIMVSLVIIGVLGGVLMPIAFQASPDENVLKFKKAHETINSVISQLVRSDKYLNGDLGTKSDGTLLVSSSANYTYLCDTISDMLTIKSKACSTADVSGYKYISIYASESSTQNYKPSVAKSYLDAACKANAATVGPEIVTTDGIVYYQASPRTTFGQYQTGTTRLFAPPEGPVVYKDEVGFDRIYKYYCIDIDGIPSGGSGSCDDIKDVCPFGYGIRADGKIISGTRADTWLQKSVQKNKK